MIAEITLVVGALKTLNAGIKTVKESGSHLSDLKGLFSTITESKVAVETIEEAAKAGSPQEGRGICVQITAPSAGV